MEERRVARPVAERPFDSCAAEADGCGAAPAALKSARSEVAEPAVDLRAPERLYLGSVTAVAGGQCLEPVEQVQLSESTRSMVHSLPGSVLLAQQLLGPGRFHVSTT